MIFSSKIKNSAIRLMNTEHNAVRNVRYIFSTKSRSDDVGWLLFTTEASRRFAIYKRVFILLSRNCLIHARDLKLPCHPPNPPAAIASTSPTNFLTTPFPPPRTAKIIPHRTPEIIFLTWPTPQQAELIQPAVLTTKTLMNAA